MSQNNEELQRLRGFENICFLQKSEVGPGLIPNFFWWEIIPKYL